MYIQFLGSLMLFRDGEIETEKRNEKWKKKQQNRKSQRTAWVLGLSFGLSESSSVIH